MYCKEISYEDFDGNQVTEKIYFNLSKAELTELEITTGGMAQYIQKIVDENDAKELVKLFKDLILMSYGVKSENGKGFVKNDRIKEEFASSIAYSEYFINLLNDTNEQIAFVNGIMPSDVIREAKKNGLIDEGGKPVEAKISELSEKNS